MKIKKFKIDIVGIEELFDFLCKNNYGKWTSDLGNINILLNERVIYCRLNLFEDLYGYASYITYDLENDSLIFFEWDSSISLEVISEDKKTVFFKLLKSEDSQIYEVDKITFYLELLRPLWNLLMKFEGIKNKTQHIEKCRKYNQKMFEKAAEIIKDKKSVDVLKELKKEEDDKEK